MKLFKKLFRLISLPFLFGYKYIFKNKTNKQYNNLPIIIGGCGRSGTTLLLSILDSHPLITGIPYETRFFVNYQRYYSNSTNILYKFKNYIDKKFIYNSYILKILGVLNKLNKSTSNRWCEKTPLNIQFIPQLLAEFNDKLKFIHIIRDGRDIVLSKHPQNKDSYWVEPQRWVNDVNAGLKYINHKNVLTIKYEDLIENSIATLHLICEFIDIPFHNNLLEYQNKTSVKNNIAWFKEAQPLNNNSIKKWKRPEHAGRLKTFYNEKGAIELLKKLGYE